MRKEVVCYGALKSVFQTTGLPSGVMPSASTAITVFLLLLYRWMTASPLSSKTLWGSSKRAAVVFGIGQRLLAVIRTIELRAKGKSLGRISSVSIRGTYSVVGQEPVVDDHIRLVGLTVFPASLFSRDVIGVDV